MPPVSNFDVVQGPDPARNPLMDFRFASAQSDVSAADECPPLWVPLVPLCGDREQWHTEGPAEGLRLGPFRGARAGEMLALSAWRRVPAGRIAGTTRDLYLEAARVMARLGHPHLLRVWHFVPDINGGWGEQEQYQQFCAGRGAALDVLGLGHGALPAASALGSAPGTPLQITFLAGQSPGQHVENPRQQSAYRYPPQYGPRPPAFARATVYRRRLLISGTAAIVGHESQYPGRFDAQLRCALDNLLLLMDHACAEADARRVEGLQARVYLRDPAHLHQAREALAADLPNLASALFLKADVCRRELLVEIEAAGRLR